VRVALGFKAHSGWSALVIIGASGGDQQVVDRRRVELVEEDALWAKQPYHAAEELEVHEARAVVERGIESARRVAVRELQAAATRMRESKHEIVACAVLVPDPMPGWTTEEILAVHFRMHKAEGVLFPDALCRAIEACGLRLATVPEKRLNEIAAKELAIPPARLTAILTRLGKTVSAPWGKDQKNATLAAMIAIEVDR
jgi:hypothetical protein